MRPLQLLPDINGSVAGKFSAASAWRPALSRSSWRKSRVFAGWDAGAQSPGASWPAGSRTMLMTLAGDGPDAYPRDPELQRHRAGLAHARDRRGPGRPARGRRPHRDLRRLLGGRPQGAAQAQADPGLGVVRAPPLRHHVGHPRPLEERRHPLPRRRHGRLVFRERPDRHHLRRAPDRKIRGRQQLHRLCDRPRPRPGPLRLPGPAHRPRQQPRPHPGHDHELAAAARLRALGGGGPHHHGDQPGAHAGLSLLVALPQPARQQAHPLRRLRRDRQVPVLGRQPRGRPAQPGRAAHPHLQGEPPDLEDQLAHGGGRLYLAGLHPRGPGALRLLRALPGLRPRPAHGLRAHQVPARLPRPRGDA